MLFDLLRVRSTDTMAAPSTRTGAAPKACQERNSQISSSEIDGHPNQGALPTPSTGLRLPRIFVAWAAPYPALLLFLPHTQYVAQ